MNDYKYHYLFTTFVSTLGILKRIARIHSIRDSIRLLAFPQDIETFDLEDFKYNFVNITAFRLVDADDVGVRSILRDMERYQPAGNTILNKSRIIQVSPREISVCRNARHTCPGKDQAASIFGLRIWMRQSALSKNSSRKLMLPQHFQIGPLSPMKKLC
jgi:hypothetical protein